MTKKTETSLWVVIPTYNRSEDLIACLESLGHAGIPTRKVIIVDNHSADDTVQRVSQTFPESALIPLEDNLGATGASNIGFERALEEGAEFVLRLDSDTVVAHDFVQPLLEMAVENPQIGILAPKIYYFDPPEEIWYAGADTHPWHFGTINGHRHEKDAPENSALREVDYAWGAAMLISAEVLRKTGGFDQDFFVYYEEVDFCQRVQQLGYQIVYIPNARIWHKVGSSANSSWTAYHWNRSKMLFYRKHARSTAHYLSLVGYAFSYALLDAVSNWLSIREKSGNRGPLKDALRGLRVGLREPRSDQMGAA